MLGARPLAAAAEGGVRRERDEPGMHDHGRAAGRLAEGSVCENEDVITDPTCLEWAGVAVFKRTYRIFKDSKCTARLLASAYRNHFHWSEFIGGDVVLTIPYKWQKRFNESDVEVMERMSKMVDPWIVGELTRKFPELRRAYEPDGLQELEFDLYGATARTLWSFICGYESILSVISSFIIQDPDIRKRRR